MGRFLEGRRGLLSALLDIFPEICYNADILYPERELSL
jgi:hypothetical protein